MLGHEELSNALPRDVDIIYPNNSLPDTSARLFLRNTETNMTAKYLGRYKDPSRRHSEEVYDHYKICLTNSNGSVTTTATLSPDEPLTYVVALSAFEFKDPYTFADYCLYRTSYFIPVPNEHRKRLRREFLSSLSEYSQICKMFSDDDVTWLREFKEDYAWNEF